MTVDLVFLAKGRDEYTRESAAALVANTDWSLVRKLVVYTDGESPNQNQGLVELWVAMYKKTTNWSLRRKWLGGPVNIMLDYLAGDPADVFAKVDNDVIVPSGWLNQCVAVMEAHEELDLLGIEPPASRTRAPWRADVPPAPECCAPFSGKIGWKCEPTFARCDAVGGIGLFRSRAWKERGRMAQHSTYGGFTDWQLAHKQRDVVKGWIVPPLNVFLLDRLPFEPWLSLGRRYQAEGLQRPWTMYDEATARTLGGSWLTERGI